MQRVEPMRALDVPQNGEDTFDSKVVEMGGARQSALFTEQPSKENRVVDPSLIFSMERTYFSALNQAILLTIAGFGLMSVESGLAMAEGFGILFCAFGVLWGFAAWFMHFWRIKRMEAGLGLVHNDSIIFTGLLNVMVLLSGVLSIYYGVAYPFLDRSQAVDVANDE